MAALSSLQSYDSDNSNEATEGINDECNSHLLQIEKSKSFSCQLTLVSNPNVESLVRTCFNQTYQLLLFIIIIIIINYLEGKVVQIWILVHY